MVEMYVWCDILTGYAAINFQFVAFVVSYEAWMSVLDMETT